MSQAGDECSTCDHDHDGSGYSHDYPSRDHYDNGRQSRFEDAALSRPHSGAEDPYGADHRAVVSPTYAYGQPLTAHAFPMPPQPRSAPVTPSRAAALPAQLLSPASKYSYNNAGPQMSNTSTAIPPQWTYQDPRGRNAPPAAPPTNKLPIPAPVRAGQGRGRSGTVGSEDTELRRTSYFSPPTPPPNEPAAERSNNRWMPSLARSADRPLSALIGAPTTPTKTPQTSSRYGLAACLPWQASSQMNPAGSSHPTPRLTSHGARPRSEIILNNSSSYIPIIEDYSIRTAGSNVFPQRAHGPRRRALSEGEVQLVRQGTLITPHADSKRASAELGVMLGSSRQKANKGKLLPQGELPNVGASVVALEAKKGNRARVEVDVVLESDMLVEGSEVRGRLDIHVRRSKKAEKIWIGAGKIRVCGYEEHSSTSIRHIFYHYPFTLPAFSPFEPSQHRLFASPPNNEGYRLANEGSFSVPFRFRLPLRGGAKGGWATGTKAPGVKYVVVGSLKLHVPEAGNKSRSISHFYRPCVVFPYVEPTSIFMPTDAPRQVSKQGGLGWSLGGEKGSVTVSARIARPTWIAGQKVWIDVVASNNSNKRIKTSQIALLRTVTLYSPPKGDVASPLLASYVPQVSRKRLCEEVIEASSLSGSGYAGSGGWWTGLRPGESNVTWQASLLLPNDCLTIPRSKLIEVEYSIRVTLNGSIYVDLPIQVVNFLSLDPPPSAQVPGPKPAVQGLAISQQMSAALPETAPVLNVSVPEPQRAMIPSPIDPKRFSQPFSLDELSYYEHSPDVSRPQRHTMTSIEMGTAAPMMGRSLSSPRQKRPPHSRADTDTSSYLAAVASPVGTEEDMARMEEHRRRGRQMSLAAIAQEVVVEENNEGVESEAHSEATPVPSQGEYVPSKASSVVITSPVLQQQEEVDEAEADLDAARAHMEQEQMEDAEEPVEETDATAEDTPSINSRARWAHIAQTRSVIGSVASGASNVETEIGQVVNAIRRDLTILRESRRGSQASQATAPPASGLERVRSSGVRSNSMTDIYADRRRPSMPNMAIRKASADGIAPSAARQRLEERMANLAALANDSTRRTSEPVLSVKRRGTAGSTLHLEVEPPSEQPELAPSIAPDSASEDTVSRATTPTSSHEAHQDPEPFAPDMQVDWGAKARPALRKSVSDFSHAADMLASPTSSVSRALNQLSPRAMPVGPRTKSATPLTTEASSPRRPIVAIPEEGQLQVPGADSGRRTRKSHTSVLGAHANGAKTPPAEKYYVRDEVHALRQRRASSVPGQQSLERKKSDISVISLESSVTAAEDRIMRYEDAREAYPRDGPMYMLRPISPLDYSGDSDGIL